MSSPTSKRAAAARDWPALLEALKAEQAGITREANALWLEGRWSDPRPSSGEDYLHALQSALEGRDASQLLKMLDSAVPIPDCLLPVLAEVIRDAKQGRSDGAASLLTQRDDSVARAYFEKLTTHLQMTKGAAREEIARLLGVSVDTIKRSLKRTNTSSE